MRSIALWCAPGLFSPIRPMRLYQGVPYKLLCAAFIPLSTQPALISCKDVL